MENWPEDFVPSDLQQDIICLDGEDHDERSGYNVNLQTGNCENDWQAASGGQDDSPVESIPITASVTVDLNGDRYSPDLRLLNTIQSFNDQASCEMQPQFIATGQMNQDASTTSPYHNLPEIEYGARSQPLLLNHWQDPHYFTSAFPTLFPTGRGGHIDDREIAVSIAAFAKWTLCHHSRRLFLFGYSYTTG
jgi:hypothetical protein